MAPERIIMGLIEYECPNCGAAITLDTFANRGKCEYCGSEFHIDHGRSTLDDGKSLTEKMQEKLEAERKEKLENAAESEEGGLTFDDLVSKASILAGVKNRLRFSVIRFFRFIFSLFFTALAAILGYKGAQLLLPEAYQMYALVGAGVLTICGLIMFFSTRKMGRGILLGLGLGVLIFLAPILIF